MKLKCAISAVIFVGLIAPCMGTRVNGGNLIFQTKKVHEAKDGWWDAIARYPVFEVHSPVLDLGSAVLDAHARNLVDGFLKDAPTFLIDGAKPTDPFSFDSSFSIAYSSKTLLSLNLSNYTGVGAAHPNTDLEAFNFGMVHGQARKLGIQDLFKPGVKAGPFMNNLLM